jgi:rubrerythrin
MIGKIHPDKELEKYGIELFNPYHQDKEDFEFYECPNCGGHFLVESNAVESIEFKCPYCQTVFEIVEPEE